MTRLRSKEDAFRFLREKGRQGILLIPLLFALTKAGAQPPVSVNQTATFNQGDLSITTITGADANTYSQVTYKALDNTGVAGSPSLPVQYMRLIVPRDVTFSAISVSASAPQTIALSRPVYPAQHPIPTGESDPPPPFAPPDPGIYGASSPFPSQLVKYIGDGYFDGDKHIITVAVYPVQYAPAAANLLFYSSITFSVSQNFALDPVIHSIAKSPVPNQDMYDRALQGMVANPQDIATFGPNNTQPKPTSWQVPFYEYVIITSKELTPAFEELIGWKRRKGLNAGIVNIKDIVLDPAAAGGDVISGINDDAGKLRKYLSEAYQHGTVYALLGGDATIIPVRYAAGDDNIFISPDLNGHIPSDLYYTDFNGNWNADGDIYYGEDGGDHVDYQPEIFVGRTLFHTQLQARNHIHKIIRYERNPGRGDNDYLSRAFMNQEDELLDGHEANIIANELTLFSPVSTTIWNEDPPPGYNPISTGPNGTDVVTEIEKYYGLVSLFGHGGPWSIVVSAAKINQCPKQYVTSTDAITGICTTAAQYGNGFDNLDDFNHLTHSYQNYPYLFYTIACETIPFDDELGNIDNLPHMGEAATSYNKAGAMAYMANTRDGWVGTSTKLYRCFIQKIAQGYPQLGVAEGLSKAVFNAIDSRTPWCKKAHCLIGCPETEFWTGKPEIFGKAKVQGSGSSVTVNTGGPDATICVTSALDNGQTYQQVVSGTATHTFNGVPSPYAVCITRHNFLPYLWQSDVAVQNHDFTGTAYVAAENIMSGQAVDPNNPTGVTTVKSTGNVFFHAEGTILLDKGFEVEPGGAFEAK